MSGCGPAMYNIGGKYYSVSNGKDCARYRQVSSDQIRCFTKDDEYTQTVTAMSDQELQMYLDQQQQSRQAWNNALNSLNSMKPRYTNCYKIGSQVNCTSY